MNKELPTNLPKSVKDFLPLIENAVVYSDILDAFRKLERAEKELKDEWTARLSQVFDPARLAQVEKERDQLREENARLKAEAEKLRVAMRKQDKSLPTVDEIRNHISSLHERVERAEAACASIQDFIEARRRTIDSSIAAEVLAGNSWKEQCECTALAEITALERHMNTSYVEGKTES